MLSFVIYIYDPFAIFVQVTQQVFVAEEVELPLPTALPLPPPKQISSIQTFSLDVEVSTGAGKGKEILSSAKDTHS